MNLLKVYYICLQIYMTLQWLILYYKQADTKINLKQDKFVKQYAPSGNQFKKASFSIKVKVSISLTLVSFERASLVKYAYQI